MKKFFQASSRSHYGLRLMTQLAAADGQFLSLQTIARREKISAGYLETMASALRQRRLIVSGRGARGGYRLAKSAREIKVSEILTALNGPIKTMTCTGNKQGNQCPLRFNCPSRSVWQKLDVEIEKTLSSLTLADLKKSQP